MNENNMKNRIKPYWSNCLSIIAIICSIIAVIRCEPITFTESWLTWAIGISISIISIAITAAIAIQIYNSVVSESKIKRIIENKIIENKEFINKKTKKIGRSF